MQLQFPNVFVQGKGLLATEAPMTIPLIEANGYVPVLDEVFLNLKMIRVAFINYMNLVLGRNIQSFYHKREDYIVIELAIAFACRGYIITLLV